MNIILRTGYQYHLFNFIVECKNAGYDLPAPTKDRDTDKFRFDDAHDDIEALLKLGAIDDVEFISQDKNRNTTVHFNDVGRVDAEPLTLLLQERVPLLTLAREFNERASPWFCVFYGIKNGTIIQCHRLDWLTRLGDRLKESGIIQEYLVK